MNDFAKRLKKMRQAKGLSQSELAEAIHVSPSLINLMESGQRNPSMETLLDLADILGTTIDFLVGRSSTPVEDQMPGGNGPLAVAYRRLVQLSPDMLALADGLLKSMEELGRCRR